MKEIWKLSGKKNEIKKPEKPWTLTARPGGWWIAEREGARKRFQIFKKPNALSASLGGRLWSGEILKQSYGTGVAAGGGDSDLTAQFPGKVRKILVEAGQEVASGQGLILIEAMKMEFEIKAPTAGVIVSVRVEVGQQLSPGDRFFDFQEREGDES